MTKYLCKILYLGLITGTFSEHVFAYERYVSEVHISVDNKKIENENSEMLVEIQGDAAKRIYNFMIAQEVQTEDLIRLNRIPSENPNYTEYNKYGENIQCQRRSFKVQMNDQYSCSITTDEWGKTY